MNGRLVAFDVRFSRIKEPIWTATFGDDTATGYGKTPREAFAALMEDARLVRRALGRVRRRDDDQQERFEFLQDVTA